MLFLALAVPATYLFARPGLEEIAKLRWLDDVSVMISKSLAYAKPKAEVSPVDPIAAANVDEDLDYRIAQRTKSPEGWRSFLTAHPGGPHAQFARAALDELVPPVTPPAPPTVQALDRGPPETKAASEVVSPPPPSAESETAAIASDEICRGDEDRLEQLSDRLTSDGVIRFLIELRCEKLRPQLLRLAERLDDKAPKTAADAAPGPSSSISPEPAASITDPPLPPRRAVEHSKQGALGCRFTRPSAEAACKPIVSAELAADTFGPFWRAAEELARVSTNASRRAFRRKQRGRGPRRDAAGGSTRTCGGSHASRMARTRLRPRAAAICYQHLLAQPRQASNRRRSEHDRILAAVHG